MSKAKFDQGRPRVVKTIARMVPIIFLGAAILVVSRPALALSDDWGQKISDEFHKTLGRVKKNNLRPIRVQFLPVVKTQKIILPKLSLGQIY